jgi:hypothetical protein
MRDENAKPERAAAAASKATKAAKTRLTRSQSGAATLLAPPARETSGTKRGRQEPSESLHAQITLKDQLAGATEAAQSAAAAADAPPAESQPFLTPPAKRRKSIPAAAQHVEPLASPTLFASIAPKKKMKADSKAAKSSAKAKASAPLELQDDASAAADTISDDGALVSPAKATSATTLVKDHRGRNWTHSNSHLVSAAQGRVAAQGVKIKELEQEASLLVWSVLQLQPNSARSESSAELPGPVAGHAFSF